MGRFGRFWLLLVFALVFFSFKTEPVQASCSCNNGLGSTCTCSNGGTTDVSPCCGVNCDFQGYEKCHVDPNNPETGCLPTGCATSGGSQPWFGGVTYAVSCTTCGLMHAWGTIYINPQGGHNNNTVQISVRTNNNLTDVKNITITNGSGNFDYYFYPNPTGLSIYLTQFYYYDDVLHAWVFYDGSEKKVTCGAQPMPSCSISCNPNPGTTPNAISVVTNANGSGGGIYGVDTYVNTNASGGYTTWEKIGSANGGGVSPYASTITWSSANASYTPGTHRVAANLYSCTGSFLYQCGNTCILNVPPPPSCTLDLLPATNTIYTNGTVNLTASYTANNAIISYVDFSSNTNTAATTVNPSRDSYAPYITRVTAGNMAGTAIITAVGTMSDGNTTCRDTATVNVIYPPPTCGNLACAVNPSSLLLGGTPSSNQGVISVTGNPTNGYTTVPVSYVAPTRASDGYVLVSISPPGSSPSYSANVYAEAVGSGNILGSIPVQGLDGSNITCPCTAPVGVTIPSISCGFTLNVSGGSGDSNSIITGDDLTVETLASVNPGIYGSGTNASVTYDSSRPVTIPTPAPTSFATTSVSNQTITAGSPGTAILTVSGKVTDFPQILGLDHNTISPCTEDSVSIPVQDFGPWWQTGSSTDKSVYGDIFAQSNIRSRLPDNSKLLDLGNNPPNHSAIVSTNVGSGATPTINLWDRGGELSTAKYQVKTDSSTGEAGRFADYSYWRQLFWNQATPISGTVNSPGDLDGLSSGIYRTPADTDMNLSAAQDFKGAGNWHIFLVDGNLILSNPSPSSTRISRDNNAPFVAFIVKNNILIPAGASNGNNPLLDGVFIAGGTFDTGSADGGAGAQKFLARGIFIAHNFLLQRDMGNLNKNQPSEVFTFDPSLILNAPAEMTHPLYSWSEMVP